MLECWDKEDCEYGTHTYIAGLCDVFRIMTVPFPDKWDIDNIQMLATGDERFKEKMDLDIQVSKLKVLKQSYFSEHYDLEDRIRKYFPQIIKECEQRIVCYEADASLAQQHKP